MAWVSPRQSVLLSLNPSLQVKSSIIFIAPCIIAKSFFFLGSAAPSPASIRNSLLPLFNITEQLSFVVLAVEPTWLTPNPSLGLCSRVFVPQFRSPGFLLKGLQPRSGSTCDRSRIQFPSSGAFAMAPGSFDQCNFHLLSNMGAACKPWSGAGFPPC